VQAATSEESLAFLAGVINKLPDPDREFYLSKALVVENSEAFRHISITGRSGLLLAPRFEEIEGAPLATQKGHHVYIPLSPDNKVTTDKIQLLRLGREAFISALEKMGLSEDDAQKYSRETGRSLSVLRRRLTKIIAQPQWAKPDSSRDIIPVLLAGRWSEKKEADKEIMSGLAGKPYESFSGILSAWLHKPDSPILKIGDLWRLVSPIDVWFALAPFLTDADLHEFQTAVLKVLRSKNPGLELDPGKRWMASAYGKESLYSASLREGLVQVLVLIAVFGDEAKIPITATAQTWVDNIVHELLYGADWKLWHSLSDVLPLIAEASPSSFLGAVESSLSSEELPIMGMFSESGDILTSHSAHPSLLWAIEGLVWNPQLLGRITLILGKLAKLDPGGKIGNRPGHSLRAIFLLWLPHTYASLENRLEAIDRLIIREPEVGWDLLVALMPRSHDSCTPTHKTRWRQFSEKTDYPITVTEHYKGIKAIIDRVLTQIDYDGHRWMQILETFSALPPEQRRRVLEQLSSCANKISDGRSEVWNKLRKILSPDTNWTLPEQELLVIEKNHLLLQPQEIIERFRWLFDEQWPHLPEGKERGDYKKREELVIQRRSKAVEVIRNEYGLDGLIKLAEQTSNPWLIGAPVAEAKISTEEEHKLLSLLEEEDKKKISFVQNYIFCRSLKEGSTWIDLLVNQARSQEWPPNKIINLFIGFPQSRYVWNILESFDKNIQEGYWRQCGVRLFDMPAEDKAYGIRQLLNVKRHFRALDTAALFIEEIAAELIAELLQKTAMEASGEESQEFEAYDIEKLFEALDKSPQIKEEDIARLEWLYLPILAEVGSGRPPRLLHKELSNNPQFFAELITFLYKPKMEDGKEQEEALPEETMKKRAHLAGDLIHSWKRVPGADDSGQIIYENLKDWVAKAKELCRKSDRGEVGDSHIGQVFAHAEKENEDAWPPEPVCQIIDEVESEELDRGFHMGIYNKRGVVTKSPLEGGRQERVLAEQYRIFAEKWIIRYPRTAAILRIVAEGYENEAIREDKEAERRDLEY
jgi:hypothetical protein